MAQAMAQAANEESGVEEGGIEEADIEEADIEEPGIHEDAIEEAAVEEALVDEADVEEAGVEEARVEEVAEGEAVAIIEEELQNLSEAPEWDASADAYIDSNVYVDGFGNEFMDESMNYIFQDGTTPEPESDDDFDPKKPEVSYILSKIYTLFGFLYRQILVVVVNDSKKKKILPAKVRDCFCVPCEFFGILFTDRSGSFSRIKKQTNSLNFTFMFDFLQKMKKKNIYTKFKKQ